MSIDLDIDSLKLHHLRLFTEVVDSRSFSQVAIKHNVTNAAISQAIKQVERNIGTILIDRSCRPFEVTSVGRDCFQQCQAVLIAFESLKHRVDTDKVSKDKCRLAAIYSIGFKTFHKALSDLKKEYSSFEVNTKYLKPDEAVDDILNDKVDLAVVSYFQPIAGISSTRIADQLMTVVVGKNNILWNKSEVVISASELKNITYVALNTSLHIRRATDEWLRNLGIQLENVVEFDSVEPVKSFISSGEGFSVLPVSLIQNEVNAGELKMFRVKGQKKLRRPLNVIYKSDRNLSENEISLIKNLRVAFRSLK